MVPLTWRAGLPGLEAAALITLLGLAQQGDRGPGAPETLNPEPGAV